MEDIPKLSLHASRYYPYRTRQDTNTSRVDLAEEIFQESVESAGSVPFWEVMLDKDMDTSQAEASNTERTVGDGLFV